MKLRDRLYQITLQYLDAYLPEQHPTLRDRRSRRRLRIVMGVGTIFDLLLITRTPFIVPEGGARLYLLILLIVVFSCGLLWLLLTRARALNTVIAMFVIVGMMQNLADAYMHPNFPPRSLPFFYMIILAGHLLFGRWYSLLILFVMSAAYIPLIYAPTEAGVAVISPLVMNYRIDVATNFIISGLMVWLISEAYDHFRESSEHSLLALNREREKDLELAARVHQELLPQLDRYGSYRIAAISRPAAVVGGDYYEALHSGRHSWFAIGDVSGHGLQAGMLGMQVRSMLSYLITELAYERPSAVLVELNNSFYQIVRKLNIRSYMTFLLIRAEDEGRIVFAGSHLKMLLLRHRDRSIEVIPSHGIWLGLEHLDQRNRILEFELHIEENDLLFLYTDGLLEAADPSGKRYGFDRMLSFLKNELQDQSPLDETVLVHNLLGDFDRFRRGVPADDDVTLFAIKRQPVTEKDR